MPASLSTVSVVGPAYDQSSAGSDVAGSSVRTNSQAHLSHSEKVFSSRNRVYAGPPETVKNL